MMDFIYTITYPATMTKKYTTNNEEAERAWRHGFKVTAHNTNFRKFYKHNNNNYQCEDG